MGNAGMSSPSETRGQGASPEEAVAAASQARQAVNLRVLLELRRRLKSVAEKELAVGADRFRGLHNELRRAEAELRLCGRLLQTQLHQLTQAASRTESAQARAAQTCARLTSLERENEDLGGQLALARQTALGLQESVQQDRHARQGTLDSFLLATSALVNELALAARDQATISARTRDLIDESEVLSARARALHACYETVRTVMADLSGAVDEALERGVVVGDELVTRAQSALAEVAAGSIGPVLAARQ